MKSLLLGFNWASYFDLVFSDAGDNKAASVAAAEKAANDGIAKYKAAHPEYEAPAVDPNWEPAMRD